MTVDNANAFSLMPFEIPETPYEDWETMNGDSFIVDTERNIGYLVHRDGGYTSFPVATGQKRVVRYIGRVYNATTPVRSWSVLTIEKKGDRITFGKDGTFLRMYNDGEDTPYGIHTHASAAKMIASLDRYRSMGCIIVSEEVLDNIIATFQMNGGRLDVLTTYGFGDDSVNYATLLEKLNGGES